MSLSNRVSFNGLLNFGNSQKLHGALSGEYGTCRTRDIWPKRFEQPDIENATKELLAILKIEFEKRFQVYMEGSLKQM